MDYQDYLNDLAEKYGMTTEKIETALYAFSGGNDELFAQIAKSVGGKDVSLQQCIEYVKAV